MEIVVLEQFTLGHFFPRVRFSKLQIFPYVKFLIFSNFLSDAVVIFFSFRSLATGNTPLMASFCCSNHLCGPVVCSRFCFRSSVVVLSLLSLPGNASGHYLLRHLHHHQQRQATATQDVLQPSTRLRPSLPEKFLHHFYVTPPDGLHREPTNLPRLQHLTLYHSHLRQTRTHVTLFCYLCLLVLKCVFFASWAALICLAGDR